MQNGVDKLKVFKNSPFVRLKLVDYQSGAYYGMGTSYKEIQLDASDILGDDPPPYYYLSCEADRLIIVWLFDFKQDNKRDYTNYALCFMAGLLDKGLPELWHVNHMLSLFYGDDGFAPHHWKLSRSKLA